MFEHHTDTHDTNRRSMAKAPRPRSNHEVPQKSMLMILTVGGSLTRSFPCLLFSLLAANSFSFCARPPSSLRPSPLSSSPSTLSLRLRRRLPADCITWYARQLARYTFLAVRLARPFDFLTLTCILGDLLIPTTPNNTWTTTKTKPRSARTTTTFLCQKSRFFHCLTANWYHSYHIPCVAMRLNFLLTYYCRLHETIPLTLGWWWRQISPVRIIIISPDPLQQSIRLVSIVRPMVDSSRPCLKYPIVSTTRSWDYVRAHQWPDYRPLRKNFQPITHAMPAPEVPRSSRIAKKWPNHHLVVSSTRPNPSARGSVTRG